MWALRRATGRRLWERPWDGEPGHEDHPLEPDSAETTIMARQLARARFIAARSERREIVVSPSPVLDLRRRTQQTTPKPRAARSPRVALLESLVAVLAVAAVAFGVAFQPWSLSEAKGSSPRPPFQSQSTAGEPSAATSMVPAEATQSAGGSVMTDLTPPDAVITGLTKQTISGSSKLRLTLTWTLTDSGSGLRSQLLQGRTDDGSWVSLSLATGSTRTAAFSMSPGHLYTFRIRGVDGAGNVGLFAVQGIRI